MVDVRRLCGNNSSEIEGSRVDYAGCQLVEEQQRGGGVTLYPPTDATEATSTYSGSSIRGIYRNKHTIRFIFRSLSFLVLVGGYSVRNYYYYGGDVDSQSLRRRVLSTLATADAAINQGKSHRLLLLSWCLQINIIRERYGGERE